MTQNYLVFCINNNVKFVDGSIPSGLITANSINKNSIFVLSPFANDTIIKAVFQPKDRAIEPFTVWTIPTDKVKPQDLINPNKSYYELVKDWYVREVKVPSLALEYISSARNTEIGITYFVEQRIVAQMPQGAVFDGYLDESTVSIPSGAYKIVEPVEITFQDLALNFNDIVYNNGGTYLKFSAIQFADNTTTILYAVDPAIKNLNFEHIDPDMTDLVLQKIGELENDIDLLNISTIKTINGVDTSTIDMNVGVSGNTRTISANVKVDPRVDNLLEATVDGLLVDKNEIFDLVATELITEDTVINDALLNAVENQINPVIRVFDNADKTIQVDNANGNEYTIDLGIEYIEQELVDLNDEKLDKVFSDLASQTLTNLNDELVINRLGVAYRTKLADLLSHVVATDLFIIVTVLPEVGQPNKFFLLTKDDEETENKYDEYIWVNNAWEYINSISIDLTNYYNKLQVDTLLNGKVDKVTNTNALYGTDAVGASRTYNVTSSNVNGSVVMRDANGRFYISNPVDPTHAVNLQTVNTLLVDKLDKITGTSTYPKAYTKLANGNSGSIDYSALAVGSALVQRNALGQIEGVDATTPTQFVTKNQLDNASGNIPTPVDVILQPSDFTSLVANKTVANLGLGNVFDVVPSANFANSTLIRTNGEAYANAEFVIQNLTNNTITFTASNLPTTDIKVTVYIFTKVSTITPSFKTINVGTTKTSQPISNANGVYLVTIVASGTYGNQTKQYIMSSVVSNITDIIADVATNKITFDLVNNGTSISLNNLVSDGMTLVDMYISEFKL